MNKFLNISYAFISIIFLLNVTFLMCDSKLAVYSDSEKFNNVGYNNCNMRTNGEHDVICQMIKPNSLVFDVGANKGEWSRYLLSMVDDVKVYSFEPIPEVFTDLQNNLSKYNSCLYNLALSYQKGKVLFFYHGNETTLGSLYKRPIVEQKLGRKHDEILVETETLDGFCLDHSIEYIDFLKIDTEGSELDVLIGAKKMLFNQLISVIQFEYGGTYKDAGITLEFVYTLLSDFGYVVYRILPKVLIEIPKFRKELENYQYSNYIAIQKDKLFLLEEDFVVLPSHI